MRCQVHRPKQLLFTWFIVVLVSGFAIQDAKGALQIYWPLEGAATTQNDSGPNNRDGAVQNGASWDVGDFPTQLTGISTGSYLFFPGSSRFFY